MIDEKYTKRKKKRKKERKNPSSPTSLLRVFMNSRLDRELRYCRIEENKIISPRRSDNVRRTCATHSDNHPIASHYQGNAADVRPEMRDT
jgi:hypothetical protein